MIAEFRFALDNGGRFDGDIIYPDEPVAFLYFGKEGVVDEERSADWGEDYLVVDYYNDDETGYIHFLFKKNDDGIYMPSSISPSFPE